MNLGIIGLGRMGHALAFRALKAGHTVVGYDLDAASRSAAEDIGVQLADTLTTLTKSVDVIWLMVPAGAVVDAVLNELMPHLSTNAIVVDGGNSNFVDSLRRAHMLAERGIYFLDCGTSGGLRGMQEGFSLMVGGDAPAYARVEPLLKALAAPGGYGHVGPSGTGHYVKMVHNGIEYGIMQAYAEGFHIIKEGSFKDQHLDLEEITRIWMHGSVIRSWLLELSHDIFAKDQQLKNISGIVQESGMGKWTVQEAHKNTIPVTVIEDALNIRAQSQTTGGNYATKVVSLLRNAFGGHAVATIAQDKR